ncbi:radical SAM protein [Streptosporangium sp. NPDC049644]|uniref:radical SAM protein n=1 Tax=Streptosporangium sp. NPDC049644 TaxID=3155507 RepID=UPI00342E3E07
MDSPTDHCPVNPLEYARSVLLSSDPDVGMLRDALCESLGLSVQAATGFIYESVLNINSQSFPPLNQLELVHTEGCNLACEYCFEKDMLGYRKMPPDVAVAAIDLLLDYSGDEKVLQVTHFGGEPTLNFAGVRYATQYAESKAAQAGKTVKFDMTTNGVRINEEIAGYCAEHEIMVLLSIDGLRGAHDRFRLDRRGRGTFDRSLKAMRLLKTFQPWIGVKMTIMPENVGTLFEDAVGLYELGVNQFLIGHATGVPWSDEQISEYGAQLSRLYLWYKDGGRDDLVIQEFDEEETDAFFGCQAGRSSIAVTVDGEISPCSKIMGFSSTRLVSKLGDVWNGLTHIRNRMDIVGCEKLESACAERGVADEFRGGCFAVNYGESGDIFTPSMQEHAFSMTIRSACSGCSARRGT